MSGTTTGTPVHIGCKHPLGIMLRVGEKAVKLNGSNCSCVIGGYGLTSVPSDMWDAWLSKHKESDLVTKRIVFAEASVAKAEGRAKEQGSVKTGLEPLNPDDPKHGVATLDKAD